MTNKSKRISELPSLSPASLDTTYVVGISGSNTYKISINQLTSSLDTTFATDLVTSALSSSLDGKVSTSSFNQYTASFTASVASGTISGSSQLTSSFDTRYVISGSITQTTWDNIANKPSGIVSQSTDLSSLNTFTASVSTASLVNRLNAIESVSGSWITESETGSFLTSLNGAISSSSQLTSSYDTRYSLSGSILTSFSTSVDSRLDTLETLNQTYTGSISGSFTGSGYVDYLIFNSSSAATLQNYMLQSNTTDKTLDLRMGNNATLQMGMELYNPPIVNKSGALLNDGDLVMFDPTGISQGNRIAVVKAISNGTYPADRLVGILTEDVANNAEGFATWFGYVRNISKSHLVPAGETWAEGDILYPNPTDNGRLTNVFPTAPNLRVTVGTVTAINGVNVTIMVNFHRRTALKRAHDVLDNSTTSSYGDILMKSGSVWINNSTFSSSVDSRIKSGSAVAGTISSSAQITAFGFVSGSSQLTSSFDGRYVLSGSVSATGTTSTNFIKYTRSTQQTSLSNGSVIVCNVLENSSGNVISPNTSTGQITLTAGKTYRLKGMVPGFTTSAGGVRPQFCWYNETTAAYIGSSAEAYAPGDAANYGSFGGASEAIITPNVTTIVSFRLLAGATGVAGIGGNTDFSTTGSYPWIDIEEIGSTFALNALNTMQISNNLAVTGSTTLKGAVNVGTGSGYEGGEIDLAYAQTTSLTGSAVVFDVYGDKVRIFENGGANRGVSIDLSKAPNSVGGELLWKTSGFVNAGTDVTLGNLKARIPTSGNRSLQLSTISGNYSVYGSAMSVFSTNAIGSTTILSGSPLSVSTTPIYLNSGNTFGNAGGVDTWYIMDTSNLIAWRVSCIIGASYNNNLITIERLY